MKLSILNDLNAAGVRPFLYGKTYDDIYHKLCGNCAPFAISSAISGDQENMDASLLMSPDYAPPLVGTELDDLINHTFDPSNIAWLKHAAAKKFLSWKSRQTFLSAPASTSASVYTSFGPSAVGSAPSSLIQASNGRNTSFALARVADHTQREERLAHARLAKWAHDLQRSLRAEKERYDRLAKGERALWLTERLGECVANGQLVPISTAMTKRAEQSHGEAVPEIWGSITARDPIGVLGAYERLTRGAAYVGCGGVLAAIVAAVWAIKEYWPEWVTAHQ